MTVVQEKGFPISEKSSVEVDVAIIGGGPAALTAAIYIARAGLKVAVFEKQDFGGTLTEIAHLENYPGFTGQGARLADTLKSQAKSAGARLEYGAAEAIIDRTRTITITIDGEPTTARAILIATGSEPNRLDLNTNKPISYCAICDGPLYKDKKVLVIGGGNSAVGEAAYLADLASEVTLINRSPLRADRTLKDRLLKKPNVKILENKTPDSALLGSVDGIFVYIGKHPATEFLPPEVLDDDGYIETDDNFMTAVPGLFAAGDVRSRSVKQVVTAAAEGASAALKIIEYLG